MIAVDTNVLVYAFLRASPLYAEAERVIRGLVENNEPWGIPWPCVYEFLNTVTNRRKLGEHAATTDLAWAQLAVWLSSPNVRLLGETDGFLDILRGFVLRPRVVGPIVHDARIAAICVAHGADVLITVDRDFSLFPELPTRNPFAA